MDRSRRREEPDPRSTPPLRWQWFRVRRHAGWIRSQGLKRLIEEDQLDPFDRIPAAIRRARWRRSHDHRPRATPVFLVGLQRSGTNMLARGLERAPEFEVHNENDGRAFDRFRLRPLDEIRDLVERSKHAFVLFKPLCDSHRTVELLQSLGAPSPGRAIWAFRHFDGRVRSSIAKFGDSNLRALRRIAHGSGGGLWQAGGLSLESLELIRSFDYDRMTPESASALFWLVRNRLFFDLALNERPDVMVASYESMVGDPRRTMRSLCSFLGLPYRDDLIQGIEPRTVAAPVVEIDPSIRSLCLELQESLGEAARNRESPSDR